MRGPRPGQPDALTRLAAIARLAGDAILAHYDRDASSTAKADGSPLTDADLASQAVIVSELTDWDPAIPILSEESALAPPEERAGWSRWWLVDPLDGTKEFLSRNGEFTVNMALIEDGEPVAGVVFAPALDVLYCASRGLGSWRSCGRRPERIESSVWHQGRPARIVESRSHPSPELEAFLRSIAVAERIRVGSSLKFCRVAEGAGDLYPRFGPVMEWDVAAGDCIYRNSAPAGERRTPFQYNTTTLRVPPFVLGLDDADADSAGTTAGTIDTCHTERSESGGGALTAAGS
jgi:3'(2'), 5'-bisphosphate nucleotidase